VTTTDRTSSWNISYASPELFSESEILFEGPVGGLDVVKP